MRALAGAGVISTKQIARIEAMAFNRAGRNGPPCSPEAEPVSASGMLCGDVRLPPATLSAAEKARVVGFLDQAEQVYGAKPRERNPHHSSRATVRCNFEPHYALMLYDVHGQLLGAMTVCLTCSQWLVRPSSPGTGGARAVLLEKGERRTLTTILNDHGLSAWLFDERDARSAAVLEYERSVYGTEADPTPRRIARREQGLEKHPSGVDRTKTLDSLTRAERDALCRWTTESVRPRRRDGNSHGYECTNGTQWRAEYGEKTCGARAFSCKGTVGSLEACLRVFREPEDLCQASNGACSERMECLPGIRRTSHAR